MPYKKNNQLPAFLKPILIVFTFIAAYFGWKTLRNVSKTASNIGTDIKSSAQASGVNTALNQSGVPAASVRGAAIVEIAENIYAALFKSTLYGWGEDEPAVIENMNSLLNIAEAKACARIYSTNYKKNLYNDINKYLSVSERQQIKTYLLTATKLV